jgi:hypothetical protein
MTKPVRLWQSSGRGRLSVKDDAEFCTATDFLQVATGNEKLLPIWFFYS